jgi:hypothetical protein
LDQACSPNKEFLSKGIRGSRLFRVSNHIPGKPAAMIRIIQTVLPGQAILEPGRTQERASQEPRLGIPHSRRMIPTIIPTVQVVQVGQAILEPGRTQERASQEPRLGIPHNRGMIPTITPTVQVVQAGQPIPEPGRTQERASQEPRLGIPHNRGMIPTITPTVQVVQAGQPIPEPGRTQERASQEPRLGIPHSRRMIPTIHMEPRLPSPPGRRIPMEGQIPMEAADINRSPAQTIPTETQLPMEAHPHIPKEARRTLMERRISRTEPRIPMEIRDILLKAVRPIPTGLLRHRSHTIPTIPMGVPGLVKGMGNLNLHTASHKRAMGQHLLTAPSSNSKHMGVGMGQPVSHTVRSMGRPGSIRVASLRSRWPSMWR